jgi:hypothetical protein
MDSYNFNNLLLSDKIKKPLRKKRRLFLKGFKFNTKENFSSVIKCLIYNKNHIFYCRFDNLLILKILLIDFVELKFGYADLKILSKKVKKNCLYKKMFIFAAF